MSRLHHPHSFSTLGRRFLCPGSGRLEPGLPEIPSDDATLGTLIGQEIPLREPSGKLGDDDMTLVHVARDFLERVAPGSKYWEWEYEVFLPLLDEAGEVVTYGWADCVYWLAEPILNVEVKAGWKGIEPELATWQVSAQTAALEQAAGRPAAGHLICLRSKETFTLQRQEPNDVVVAIKRLIAEATAPESLLTPSASACRYCRALSTCPAVERSVMTVTAPCMDLSPEKRARRREAVEMVEKWARAVRDDDKRHLEAGGEIPGWGLQAQEGNRKIENPVLAYQRLQELLSQEQYLACLEARIGPLEKAAVGALLARGSCATKVEAEGAFERLLGDALSRGPGFSKVVRVKPRKEQADDRT